MCYLDTQENTDNSGGSLTKLPSQSLRNLHKNDEVMCFVFFLSSICFLKFNRNINVESY